MKSLVILIFMLCVTHVELQQQPRGRSRSRVDNTRTEGALGEDVVTAVVMMIKNSKIFPDDKQFLRRIAFVESMDGNHPNTYRRNYHGGIWQVDRIGFKDTQDDISHPSLVAKYSRIADKLGIDWKKAKWEDLRMPLYSGLAARLFLSLKPGEIPDTIQGQARYWKEHYNTAAGAGTVQGFIDKATQLDSQMSASCTVNTDLVFVMDESGSIGGANFQQMKTFVRNFANGLEIGRERSQVAVITFSSSPTVQFNLNAYSMRGPLLAAIDRIGYNGGGTNTAAALRTLINSGFSEANGARPGVLRIAVVMTDGISNTFSETIQEAQNLHLVVPTILAYAIGIGDNVNNQELEAIASRPEFIVQLQSFNPDEFRIVQEDRTREICFEVSTPVDPNGMRNSSLARGNSERLQFSELESGVTVRLCVTRGRIIFYVARSMTPSEAVYDWRIVSEQGCNTIRLNPDELDMPGNKRKKRQSGTAETLFVTIRGDGDGENSYELVSSTDKPGQAVQIEPKTQETVTEGDSITFSCLGSNPGSINVERRRNGADATDLSPLGSRLRINQTTTGRIDYIFGPLLAEDHNTFLYCSSGASISTEVLLTVFFSPCYQELPTPVLTVIHRDISTLSFILKGNPSPEEYRWYKDGEILSPSFRVNIQADSLRFNPAYVGDVGSYLAVASNYLGNGTLSFQLTVDYAPRYTEQFGSFSCQENGEVIECLATAGSSGFLKCIAFGKPQAMLSLETRVDGSTDNVQFDPRSGDVQITSVSADNKGLYTCVARNSIAEVRRTFTLLVGDDDRLPPVEDFQATVRRIQDNLVLTIDWKYNTSALPFPPSSFRLSLYPRQSAQPLRTWTLSRDHRSITRSLSSLNLRQLRGYRLEIYSQNALGNSEARETTFTIPNCPPPCSSDFCTARPTRTSMCTIPSVLRTSNCSVLCPVTLCHACYFAEGEPRNASVLSCTSCSEGYAGGTLTGESKCLKRWAQCIRRADFGQYGKLPRARRTKENFKCYEHPCV